MTRFFLRNPQIDPTNNHAERMIRAAVCYRSVRFGVTSYKGERWQERSLSLRKTCDLSTCPIMTRLRTQPPPISKGMLRQRIRSTSKWYRQNGFAPSGYVR
ncbi:MAG: transposase [Desulfovibrionaceae bacterium]|nr:transposase [Desulfovibrionaceae bacterium]